MIISTNINQALIEHAQFMLYALAKEKTMDPIQTGKYIATLRKEKGLTQADLAKTLNVTTQAISKWECGKSLPQVNLLLPLANALGVKPADILEGEKTAPDDAFSEEQIKTLFFNCVYSYQQEQAIICKKKIKKAFILLCAFSIAILILLVFLQNTYIIIHYTDVFPSIEISQGSDQQLYMQLHTYRHQYSQNKVIAQNGKQYLFVSFRTPIWDFLTDKPTHITRVLLTDKYAKKTEAIFRIYYCDFDISKLSNTNVDEFLQRDNIFLIWEGN